VCEREGKKKTSYSYLLAFGKADGKKTTNTKEGRRSTNESPLFYLEEKKKKERSPFVPLFALGREGKLKLRKRRRHWYSYYLLLWEKRKEGGKDQNPHYLDNYRKDLRIVKRGEPILRIHREGGGGEEKLSKSFPQGEEKEFSRGGTPRVKMQWPGRKERKSPILTEPKRNKKN